MAVAQPSVVRQPTETYVPPTLQQPKRPAAKLGMALKSIGQPAATTSEADITTTTTAAQPDNAGFTAQALINCWDAFAESVGKRVHLKNTMINNKPVLQDDYSFEVTLHNPGQQEELEKNSYEIMNFLRQNLKNNQIQMRIRISEANEKQLAYTSYEKYDLLLKTNPAIAKLKAMFDLRIE